MNDFDLMVKVRDTLIDLHTNRAVSWKFVAVDSGVPYGSLRNFVCGSQALSNKHITTLCYWLNNIFNIDLLDGEKYEYR